MEPLEQQELIPGRVGLVGLGLIGGSFARAFAKAGREVFVFDPNTEIADLASIDTTTGELTDEVIPTCELIVLACYPAACVEWLKGHANLVNKQALVIDTGGVKRAICEPLFAIAREAGITFLGCHPMAGTQFSGYAHSKAEMFVNAPMVVCPAPELKGVDCLEVVDRLEQLLEPCGFGRYTVTTPARHDAVIAYTSQLAHVVSNAYVKSPTLKLRKGFSAGSYKDLTRVAQLNPDMWCELFLADADFLSEEIGIIIGELQKYKDALDAGDAKTLRELLAEGDKLKRADIEGENIDNDRWDS